MLDGKIKPSKQRYLGLDKAEQALIDLHTGDNFGVTIGKAVAVVSDDTYRAHTSSNCQLTVVVNEAGE